MSTYSSLGQYHESSILNGFLGILMTAVWLVIGYTLWIGLDWSGVLTAAALSWVLPYFCGSGKEMLRWPFCSGKMQEA